MRTKMDFIYFFLAGKVWTGTVVNESNSSKGKGRRRNAIFLLIKAVHNNMHVASPPIRSARRVHRTFEASENYGINS